jgi:hypothetical protein
MFPNGWLAQGSTGFPPQPPTVCFVECAESAIETVAKFKAAWPNLDPYACRYDFDAWLEKLPERKPRQYDRAFLGFAKKWAIGKT